MPPRGLAHSPLWRYSFPLPLFHFLTELSGPGGKDLQPILNINMGDGENV